MSHYPYRRRQFFIKKELQGKFILFYAVTLVALAGMITWALSIKIDRALEWHIYSSHLKLQRTGDLLVGLLLETNVIAIAAILALVMIISVLVVNRLNLHFYRMCNVVDAMSNGRFTAPKPPRSMFHEVSVVIDLVDELRGHYQDRYAQLRQLTRQLDSATHEDLPGIRQRLHSYLSQTYLPATDTEDHS